MGETGPAAGATRHGNTGSPLVDGKHLIVQAGGQPGAGERAFASFLVMDPNILMLSDGGELILFAAKPAGFELLSRSQACGTTWCSPAYADGKLYVRDARALFCFQRFGPPLTA